MKKRCVTLFLILLVFVVHAQSFRQYSHVRNFYRPITESAIALGIEYKIPPAAVLAIAGLESGFGRGYVARITGNILSLGAMKSDKKLPPLYLPEDIKTKNVLIDPIVISSKDSSELIWKKRPPSLKKDYRPNGYAGKQTQLEFFKYNPEDYKEARIQNIEDFMTKWISHSNKVKSFKKARVYLDSVYAKDSVSALFSEKVCKEFINRIGGRPYSFNYRKTWPVKVNKVMKKTGLVNLCKNIYIDGKTFDEAWGDKVIKKEPDNYFIAFLDFIWEKLSRYYNNRKNIVLYR